MLNLEYCCDILAVCVIASYLCMILNKGQMDCMPSAFGKTTELNFLRAYLNKFFLVYP